MDLGNRPVSVDAVFPGGYRDSGLAGLRNRLGYPDGPVAYFGYIDRWRTSGEFEGLEFRSRQR